MERRGRHEGHTGGSFGGRGLGSEGRQSPRVSLCLLETHRLQSSSGNYEVPSPQLSKGTLLPRVVSHSGRVPVVSETGTSVPSETSSGPLGSVSCPPSTYESEVRAGGGSASGLGTDTIMSDNRV